MSLYVLCSKFMLLACLLKYYKPLDSSLYQKWSELAGSTSFSFYLNTLHFNWANLYMPFHKCFISYKNHYTCNTQHSGNQMTNFVQIKWIVRRKMKSNSLLPPLCVTKKQLLHILVQNSQPLFLQFPASQQSSWWRCSSFLSFPLLLSLCPLQKTELCMGGHTCKLLS